MSTPALSREDGVILKAIGRLEGAFEQHAENVNRRFDDLNTSLSDMRKKIDTLEDWKTATEAQDHMNRKWRKTVQGFLYSGCVMVGSAPNWFPFLLNLFKGKQGH